MGEDVPGRHHNVWGSQRLGHVLSMSALASRCKKDQPWTSHSAESLLLAWSQLGQISSFHIVCRVTWTPHGKVCCNALLPLRFAMARRISVGHGASLLPRALMQS